MGSNVAVGMPARQLSCCCHRPLPKRLVKASGASYSLREFIVAGGPTRGFIGRCSIDRRRALNRQAAIGVPSAKLRCLASVSIKVDEGLVPVCGRTRGKPDHWPPPIRASGRSCFSNTARARPTA